VSSTIEEVQRRVLTVIREIVPDIGDLSLEFSLADELDSLDRITLFMALEEEFGGKLEPKDVEHINTVNDAAEYICKRMAAEDSGGQDTFQYEFDQPAAKH